MTDREDQGPRSEYERELLIAELGAYLDKEVTPEQARATERKLFLDPEALSLLRALREDQARLTADLDRLAAAPPPERLLETIQAGFEERATATTNGIAAHGRRASDRPDHPTAGPGSRAPWWTLAAASLAFLLVGGGAGVWWAESRLETALARFEVRSEVERGVIAATVSRALETRVSGEALTWESGEVSGRVVPLRTYQSKSGHWCREYERTTSFKDGMISVLALACRTENGEWVTIKAEPRALGRGESVL